MSRRQLDYGLIDATKTSWIIDALAKDGIGAGVDHRTVELAVWFCAAKGRLHRRGQLTSGKYMYGWKPSNVTTFHEHLDVKLLAMQSCQCSVTDYLQAKCEEIEAILLEVADKCRQAVCMNGAGTTGSKRRLHELIEGRRAARKAGSKDDVRSASNVIRKEISATAKAKKSARVREVLDEFKDLKRTADIRGNGKRVCIRSMIDSSGTERTARHDISEVFAEFFESIYHGSGEVFDAGQHLRGEDVKAERVTNGEVRPQLGKIKLRKAADEAGLMAEC